MQFEIHDQAHIRLCCRQDPMPVLSYYLREFMAVVKNT